MIMKVVGRGAYGKVYKAKFRRDDEIYAIKAIKKEFLLKRNQVYYAMIERK
jgi:serine/threonine protein kinase